MFTIDYTTYILQSPAQSDDSVLQAQQLYQADGNPSYLFSWNI